MKYVHKNDMYTHCLNMRITNERIPFVEHLTRDFLLERVLSMFASLYIVMTFQILK